ncbi:MAG: metallophosphoesterase [Bacteroidota bacterium]
MRVIQITDLHIGQTGEATYGVDVRANFIKILEEAKALSPDIIVVTGDFCFKAPQRSIYQWVRPHLEALQIPYRVISGNHDEPSYLAEEFALEGHLHEQELYYQEIWGDWPVFFLDTTIAKISTKQLNWLAEKLEGLKHDTLIFMHHPPMNAGVPYMDLNHHFKDQEMVCNLFEKQPFRCHIFTGHYHVEKMVQRKNLSLYITPACFFQINQYQDDFAPDHHRIGMRMIELRGDDLLSTVHYFDGASL